MAIGVKIDRSTLENLVSTELKKVAGQIAAITLAKAIADCPVDTGHMKSTAYLKDTGTGYEVGFEAPYAIYVHEMPQSSIKQGRSRWLSNALNDAASDAGVQVVASKGSEL